MVKGDLILIIGFVNSNRIDILRESGIRDETNRKILDPKRVFKNVESNQDSYEFNKLFWSNFNGIFYVSIAAIILSTMILFIEIITY